MTEKELIAKEETVEETVQMQGQAEASFERSDFGRSKKRENC